MVLTDISAVGHAKSLNSLTPKSQQRSVRSIPLDTLE